MSEEKDWITELQSRLPWHEMDGKMCSCPGCTRNVYLIEKITKLKKQLENEIEHNINIPSDLITLYKKIR